MAVGQTNYQAWIPSRQGTQRAALGTMLVLALLIGWLQLVIDQRNDPLASHREDLAHLPKGEHLKPVLLGYHHLGADILWLRTIQVLGKAANTSHEYEWLYRVFNVITTLDPQYEYAYKVAGITLTELAERPELSNRILAKGIASGQRHWYLPYHMAYNYYFYLGDVGKAIEAARLAAESEGNPPPWVINMVTQMSTQVGNPNLALSFLMQMHQQAIDPRIKDSLEYHIKEVIIERDIRQLEPVVQEFYAQEHRYPRQLTELITKKYLIALPSEPFGGTYVVEEDTGRISSSAHPQRLKMYAQPGSEARKRDN